MGELFSNCCSATSSKVEIVDGLGMCGRCSEWCEFIGGDQDMKLDRKPEMQFPQFKYFLAALLLWIAIAAFLAWCIAGSEG